MKHLKLASKSRSNYALQATEMDLANKTWKVEEIFQDIPGDPDNVKMVIPDEIAEYLELNEGDEIHIEVTESGMTITKK